MRRGTLFIFFLMNCGRPLLAIETECYFYANTGGVMGTHHALCHLQKNEKTPSDGKVSIADEQGQPQCDLTWSGGKKEGKAWYLNSNGDRVDLTFHQDVAEGEIVVKRREGTECRFSVNEGKTNGVLKEFDKKGKLRAVKLYENGKDSGRGISFCADGKVRALECGTQSISPEDQKPCGFDHEQRTTLLSFCEKKPNDYPKVTYLDGKLLRQESLYFAHSGKAYHVTRLWDPKHWDAKTYSESIDSEKGKPFQRSQFLKGELDGSYRTYFETGELEKDCQFKSGQVEMVTAFFMNGKPHHSMKRSGKDKWQVITYWDQGQPKMMGEFSEPDPKRNSKESQLDYVIRFSDFGLPELKLVPQGVVKTFASDGKMESEAVYDHGLPKGARKHYESNVLVEEETYEKGRLVRLKQYDPKSGKFLKEERVFADGSKKTLKQVPLEASGI